MKSPRAKVRHAQIQPQLIPLPNFALMLIARPAPNKPRHAVLRDVDEPCLLHPAFQLGANVEAHAGFDAGFGHQFAPLRIGVVGI